MITPIPGACPVDPIHDRAHHFTRFHLRPIRVIPGLLVIEPVGYLEFLRLSKTASTGKYRTNRQWRPTRGNNLPRNPLPNAEGQYRKTIDVGTNVLTGSDPSAILKEYKKIMNGDNKKGRIPNLWDGHSAERIIEIITGLL